MESKIQQEIEKKPLVSNLKEPFYILTTTLLSLLLPLSFILLSRISAARLLLLSSSTASPPLPFSLFLYTNPPILHSIIGFVSVSTLIHGFQCLLWTSNRPVLGTRLFVSWVLLCTVQVCVGVGIEGSIAAGVDGSGYGCGDHGRSLLCRIVFFLGLHETMLYWRRSVVKPVVDDAVYGFSREEMLPERVAAAAAFGCLWWWKLKEEVESLVVVVELEREMLVGVGVGEFIGGWLYYLTVTIGMSRVVTGLVWVATVALLRWVRGISGESPVNDENEEV